MICRSGIFNTVMTPTAEKTINLGVDYTALTLVTFDLAMDAFAFKRTHPANNRI